MNKIDKKLFSATTSVVKKCAVIMLCLFLVGSIPACKKSNSTNTNGIYDVWECMPEYDPDVTITLTFDLKQVYVSTSPKDLSHACMIYVFMDGDQFIVREDTMYCVDSTINDINIGCAFAITKTSPDSMYLEYLGMLPDQPSYVREYLFKSKTN